MPKPLLSLIRAQSRVPPSRLGVEGQPFDRLLLHRSPVYRRSRELYLREGGVFEPALLTSARTLSSPILVENRIEYSPVERELFWRARAGEELATLRPFFSSLFHEQNHRLLWSRIGAAPKGRAELRRYLNFAESLVIVSDMALADALHPSAATVLRGLGVIYDPGTSVLREARDAREYRNYLQACLHATYLNLELFDRKLIARLIPALYANAGPLAARAVRRAGHLNRGFITRTNLVWQHRHRARVIEALGPKRGQSRREPLRLDDDPRKNWQQYALAESWFDALGL